MSSSASAFALILGLIFSSAHSVDCQQARQLEIGIQPAAPSVTDTHPSGRALTIKSVEWSAYGSLLGGVLGLTVDDAYCNRHHGHEQGFIFGPCTFYYNEGFGVGWFGGAIIGSTFGAARIAEKRGCPRREAIWRAMAAAAIGVAPGAIIAARRLGRYPPSRSLMIATAPLLGGIGAAAAVVGCHAK
jgi:hypothetical protein